MNPPAPATPARASDLITPAERPPSSEESRSRYSEQQRQLVRDRYPLCRTLADKEQLASDAGIGSLQKLYNLASRIGVTARSGGGLSAERGYSEAMRVAQDPARLKLREDPATTQFSARDDDYLRKHFGRQEIAAIAIQCSHSEIAMAYRARQLGLRLPVRWWDQERVGAWLGLSADEMVEMGIPLHPCCDRRGRLRIVLVKTDDLSAALFRGGRWQRLVAERDADLFFVREILESRLAVNEGAEWAPTWVSHGHTCLNPFSGLSFGLFYDGTDAKLTGAHYSPEQLSPRAIAHAS